MFFLLSACLNVIFFVAHTKLNFTTTLTFALGSHKWLIAFSLEFCSMFKKKSCNVYFSVSMKEDYKEDLCLLSGQKAKSLQS